MISQELATSWTRIGLVLVSSVAMLTGIVVYVRIAGLRSFSKLSAFDFAVTVAFGSVLATVALSGSSLLDGLAAAAALLAAQTVVGFGRSRFGWSRFVDNTPLLLMVGSEMIGENLRLARMTESDVRAKLREANVADVREVQAVVLETTGDVSVVHGHARLDLGLFAGVVGADRLPG